MVAPTSSPEQTAPKQRANANEIKVFISHRDSKCENKGALCLACTDLEELVFLPTGDAALTRRSKKYSTLYAIVLKFSKARGRYMNDKACWWKKTLSPKPRPSVCPIARSENRNERARERRAEADEEYVTEFAKRLRSLFPKCPEGREQIVAEHACLKYSGRVGRSAGAKSFAEEMVTLAVIAHVRHRETDYDSLLAKGWSRSEARAQVRDRVEALLEKWRD